MSVFHWNKAMIVLTNTFVYIQLYLNIVNVISYQSPVLQQLHVINIARIINNLQFLCCVLNVLIIVEWAFPNILDYVLIHSFRAKAPRRQLQKESHQPLPLSSETPTRLEHCNTTGNQPISRLSSRREKDTRQKISAPSHSHAQSARCQSTSSPVTSCHILRRTTFSAQSYMASNADGPVKRNFWGTWMKQAESWKGETRRIPMSLTLKKHSTK